MVKGDLHPDLRVILIGGTSHVGKSTVSELLAVSLGREHLSTDSLARHPGRPWKPAPEKVPAHVAEHYLSLSVDELVDDVLRHYRVNVWPMVEEIVASYSSDPASPGIVVEGSALWPELAAGLDFGKVAAIWLTASQEVLRQRIHEGSGYGSKSSREREMIDKFLQRTVAYDLRMVDSARKAGLVLLDVEESDVMELTERCLSALGHAAESRSTLRVEEPDAD